MWNICKKVGFFATGAGVALDLAAKIAKPSVSTVGNLIAVAGGSIYSITKNFETARGISEKRRNCFEIAHEMHEWAGVNDIDALLGELSTVGAEAQRIIDRIEIINNPNQGYIYAAINIAAQLTLSAISIGINATVSRQESDGDIWNNPIQIANMFLVPVFVISQYVVHSVFIAKPLRSMDDQSIELKTELEKLKGSIQAQVLKLNKFARDIDDHYQRLTSLDDSIRRDNEQVVVLRATISEIESKPVPIGEDESIGIEFTRLSENLQVLEQKIISSMEDRNTLAKVLRALVSDTDKIVTELRINFARHEQFESIVQHFQETKSQLSQEETHGDPLISSLEL